jgi:hypothetical protein
LPNGSSANSALCWNDSSWVAGPTYVSTGQTGTLNYIKCPSSPVTNYVLCYDGSNWVGGSVGAAASSFNVDDSRRNYVYKFALNTIGNSTGSMILQGTGNTILQCSLYSHIVNGRSNIICDISCNAFIQNGTGNSIKVSSFSSISNGRSNVLDYVGSSDILNGTSNINCLSYYSTIINGCCNVIYGCCFSPVETVNASVILGGSSNVISGSGIKNVFIAGSGIRVTGSNTVNTLFANNICLVSGKYYGDGSSLTGLQTGCFALLNPIPIVSSNSTYSITLSDNGKPIVLDSSSSIEVIVPTNSSEPFNLGTQIILIQKGTGQVCVTSSANILSNGGKTKLSAQGSVAALIKIDTNEWSLGGDLTI